MKLLNCIKSANKNEQVLLSDLLPLTIFEEYMLLDDSPAFPMDFCCRFYFHGKPDAHLLEQAIRQAALRHPLLRSKIQKKKQSSYFWVLNSQEIEIRRQTIQGDFADITENSDYYVNGFPKMEPIDLFNQSGFRAYLIEFNDIVDFVIQIHHSVCDGKGELGLIHDILMEYAALIGVIPQEFERRRIDETILNQRGKLGWGLKGYLKNLFYTDATTRRFLYSKALPFLPGKNVSLEKPCGDYPFVFSFVLNSDQTSTLKQYAQAQNVTVNDLLMTDLFWVIKCWQTKNETTFRRGVLRLAIPINVRSKRQKEMSLGNVVSMVFVDVSPKIIEPTPAFLQNIHRKMETIKNHDQKYVLNLILKAGKFLTGLIGKDLTLFLRSGICRGTACLTNLGPILDSVPLPRSMNGEILLGNCILKSLETVAPIRKGTQLSISAQTYAASLRLCLRFDPTFFSLSEMEELRNLYQETILAHLPVRAFTDENDQRP